MIKERFKNRYIRSISDNLDDCLKIAHHYYPELQIYSTMIDDAIFNTLEKISISGINDDAKVITIDSKKCNQIGTCRLKFFKRYYESFCNDLYNYRHFRIKDGFLKQIMDEDIEALSEKMDNWKNKSVVGKNFKKNNTTHLIEYPLFDTLSEKKKIKLFIVDLEYNVSRLCMTEEYKEFVQPAPSMQATFSGENLGGRGTYDDVIEDLKEENYPLAVVPNMATDVDQLNQEEYAPAISIQDMIVKAKKNSNFVMDMRSYNLVTHITTRIYEQIVNNIKMGVTGNVELEGSVNELALVIDPELRHKDIDTSHHFYTERALTTLINVAKYRPEAINEEEYTSYAFIDKLSLKQVKKDSGIPQLNYNLTVGNGILSSLFNDKINYVLAEPMKKLTSNHAKLIYNEIRRERLEDLVIGKDTRVYTYLTLYLISNSAGSKKERFKKYKKAFMEIKEADLLFSRVEFDSENFRIYVKWLPLSDEERADLESVGGEEIDIKVKNIINTVIKEKSNSLDKDSESIL